MLQCSHIRTATTNEYTKDKWLTYASKIMYNEDQGSIQPPTRTQEGLRVKHPIIQYELLLE